MEKGWWMWSTSLFMDASVMHLQMQKFSQSTIYVSAANHKNS